MGPEKPVHLPTSCRVIMQHRACLGAILKQILSSLCDNLDAGLASRPACLHGQHGASAVKDAIQQMQLLHAISLKPVWVMNAWQAGVAFATCWIIIDMVLNRMHILSCRGPAVLTNASTARKLSSKPDLLYGVAFAGRRASQNYPHLESEGSFEPTRAASCLSGPQGSQSLALFFWSASTYKQKPQLDQDSLMQLEECTP